MTRWETLKGRVTEKIVAVGAGEVDFAIQFCLVDVGDVKAFRRHQTGAVHLKR